MGARFVIDRTYFCASISRFSSRIHSCLHFTDGEVCGYITDTRLVSENVERTARHATFLCNCKVHSTGRPAERLTSSWPQLRLPVTSDVEAVGLPCSSNALANVHEIDRTERARIDDREVRRDEPTPENENRNCRTSYPTASLASGEFVEHNTGDYSGRPNL